MVRIITTALRSGTLINMTLTGSIIILFVLLARLCLRRAPKVYSYALWGVVLFRLLFPVSITAPVSALNLVRPEVTAAENTIQLTMYVANVPAASGTIANTPALPAAEVQSAGPVQKQADPMVIAAAVWAAGFLAMAVHGFTGFFRLRKKLTGAVMLRRGVYLADGIDTPFVLGVLHPRIYLPSAIPDAQRPLILVHERCHIRRLDMLWKLLGYLALCLHWFNPLVWTAFVLAGKDMEMSCDEAVLRRMDRARHADYAAALLQLSSGRRAIAGTPLAFGEGDAKGRIRNMAKWKKPKIWVTLLCVLLCLAAAVTLLTAPEKDQAGGTGKFELVIGAENVSAIHVRTPQGSGVCTHADGSSYEAGETVFLEPMTGLDSFAGVTVEAFDRNGEVIWFCSVPEEMTRPILLHDGTWYLRQTVSHEVGIEQITVGPCSIGIEGLNFTLPEGAVMHTADPADPSGTVHTILSGNETIGGIRVFPMEAEPARDDFDWISRLELTEWERKDIGFFMDSTGEGRYSAELFQDVPPGTERTVLNMHYFYYSGGAMYDLWFDELKADSRMMDAILASVSLQSVGTELHISDVYAIGKMPEGYTAQYSLGSIVITDGTNIVGGITGYPIPLNTYDPEDGHFTWLERSGISDFGDTSLYYEGGMTFSEDQWSARFTRDNPKADRNHVFQIAGNYIFDIWMDGLALNYDTQQEILRAFPCKLRGQLPDTEHTLHSQSDDEETAYRTIAAFLNALQEDGAAYIVQDRQPIGAAAPGARSGYFYLAEGDLYYNITEMLPSGKMQETALVMVDGRQYSGRSEVFGDDLVWAETREDFAFPWLAGIEWNRQNFQYTATMTDPGGTVYLYHSNFWFEEDDGGYFVSFFFNPEGRFDHVTIRVNQYMDNDYEVTESILNTDSASIHQWIERELEKAAG